MTDARAAFTERRYVVPLVLVTSLFLLWALGVNLNFAPVLDLRPRTKLTRFDFHTLIGRRAISGDPAKVASFGLRAVPPGTKAANLSFKIDAASYPNWGGGAVQTRRYELKGDELSYRVSPRPNGEVPISIWRRIN